jgi:capsule polysaccharide export protein KpsC/LpsZ
MFDLDRVKLLPRELKNQAVYIFTRLTNPVYRIFHRSNVAFMYIEHPIILPFVLKIRRYLGVPIHFLSPEADFSQYRKVIIPNGLWPSVKLATDRIPAEKRLYCEIGFMPQTKNVYFDPKGVHGHSSTRDIALTPLAQPEKEKLDNYRAQITDSNFVRVKWDSIDLANEDAEANSYDFEFVFVPLQLEEDTAFELCPFDSNQEIITYIENALPGKKILFKVHPSDSNTRYAVQDRNLLLPRSNKNLKALLTHCSAVVASNSTVILEALLLEKKCATFGIGFTTNHHLALECHEDLSRLSNLDEWEPVAWKNDSFLYAMFERQFSIEFPDYPEEMQKLTSYLNEQGIPVQEPS